MRFLSKIYGVYELVEEGKITKEQADRIMNYLIDKAVKLDKEEGLSIHLHVTEAAAKKILKKLNSPRN